MEIVQTISEPSRLARGRSYARSGAVQSVEVSLGVLHAYVRGSQNVPYSVRLIFQTVPEIKRATLLEKMIRSPHILAPLLEKEMPHDLESLFLDEGIAFFPSKIESRRFFCTCTDSSDCCKHALAALHLLAEVFDENPLALLRLRGINRNDLIAAAFPQTLASHEEGDDLYEVMGGGDGSGELTSDEVRDFRFYGDSELVAMLDRVEVTTSGLNNVRLPEYPFWRGSRSFQESMATFYDAAGEHTKK